MVQVVVGGDCLWIERAREPAGHCAAVCGSGCFCCAAVPSAPRPQLATMTCRRLMLAGALTLLGVMLQSCLVAAAAADADNATVAPSPPITSAFRLPRTVLPSHYDVYIETFLGDDNEIFKFAGHVVIKLAATTVVQQIRLHAKELDVQPEGVRLMAETGAAPAVADLSWERDRDFLVVVLDGPLTPGTAYQLRLEFSAPLGEGLAGYYRSSYQDRASGQTRWLAVTQFESIDARRAFPCFDEPSFKATFSISLAHLKKYSAISNMPLTSSQPLEGRTDWVVDRFERSWRMSTYLVAILVSDLKHVVSATADNTTLFRVWARREALLQAEYAAEVGPRILTFYERFFQVPYPLPKQDMVAIPDFAAGAMENWGLITYRERLLLFDEQQSSLLAKRDVASVVAHELAHQWFGNLVTMRWWSDLWLNEGFATYVATLGVNAVHPNWRSLESDALTNLLTVMKFDALDTSHPLSVKLMNPAEISQIFDAISYKKGSFLIRMMSQFLGEEVFRSGLTNYLRKHRMDNAEQDDLWLALTNEAHAQGALPAHISVKSVMDTWTLQKGYPLLTLSRDYDGRSLNISQSKYLTYQLTNPRRSQRSSCWEIPVTYTTAKSPQEVRRAWLHCGQDTRTLQLELDAGADEWVLLNVNATGLFRVLYDARGWELLTAALQGEPSSWQLDPLSRALLLEDALSLAWSGDLSYGRAFTLLSYLRREPHFLPWKAAFNGLSSLNRLLRRTSNFGLFQTFLTTLLEETLKKWGDLQQPLPEDDLEAFRQRGLVVSWACRLGVPRCLDQATSLFADWMQRDEPDQNNPLPRGLRYEITCTAVKHGGTRQWEFAWQRYLASNVASERIELLQALGCAREPWLLQRLLEWSIQVNKGIRRQDSATVFVSVARNEYGFHVTKDFFTRNIAQLHRFYGPSSEPLSAYISAVVEAMFSEADLRQFDDFTEKNSEYLKQVTLAVKQARDKISVNLAWYDAHYEELIQQLQRLTQAQAQPTS